MSRRNGETFFQKFCEGKGLDIGYGGDPLTPACDVWDIEHGDAHDLASIQDQTYDYVYSSHTLEHLTDPARAIQNWWRVLKPGGYLLLYVPHRDYYEKKKELPSRWNPDHKSFFLPELDELPHTLGVLDLIKRSIAHCEIVYLKDCTEGFTLSDPSIHSDGEYSIEAVLRKPE